ncbi:12617_t:CDS:2 [Dentiscutata erythropus]|uniref:12617_t:CDS:1 n=1 Tax=Dentiscutata erythropus TaxID=1348616 RepID=A0A9N8WGX7_9GLOM|nr:12617_t:CDS:2 [Dentiscutata erythropus]
MTDMVDSTESEIEPYIIINNNASESRLNTTELTEITEKVEKEIILNRDIAKNDESEVKADIDKNFEKDINLSKEIKSDPSAAQLERSDYLRNDSEKDSETCNKEIEQLIQELQLDNDTDFIKWFPYEKFQEIEYLGHGGYGTTYYAKSKETYINSINLGFGYRARNGEAIVILKHLNNSKEMIINYLNMVKKHHQFIKKNHYFAKCYGISQCPKTKEYVMVMEYIRNNDLHNCLFVNHNGIKFDARKNALITITRTLASLHKEGIVHRNLHSKNILVNYSNFRLGEMIASLSEANASDERKNRKMKGPSRGGPMLSSTYTKHPDAIFTSQLWPTLFELEQSGFVSSDKISNNTNDKDLLESKKLSNDEPHLSESKDLLDDKELEESYFLDFRSSESFNDSNDSDNTDDTEDFIFSESDVESFDNFHN